VSPAPRLRACTHRYLRSCTHRYLRFCTHL